jgi:hypothetical protein
MRTGSIREWHCLRHRAARQEGLREVAGATFGFSFLGFLISFF